MVRDYVDASVRKERRDGKEREAKEVGRWSGPDKGKVKIKIDASFKYDSMRTAVGIIRRDDRGMFIGGMGMKVVTNSPFMAECMAALAACDYMEQIRKENIILETDCQQLHRHLKNLNSEGCEWESEDILQRCIIRWRQVKDWSISLINRKGNKAADHLAAGALRGVVPKGWFYEPPPSLEVLIQRERDDEMKTQQEKTGIG